MRWAGQLLSWMATFVAARLLTPADYGVLAMATIAIGLARMVEDFGLDAILVQDRTIGARMQSELAGLIVGVGAGLCVLFIALAHPIADFFREPRVAPALFVLSALCLTDALQVVPRALLQRDLAFKRLALAQFVQVGATQLALIAAAVGGLGYLSLAFNSVAGAVAVTALLLVWRPISLSWPRGLQALSNPLRQGWRMIVTRVAYYGYSYADQTLIGRVLGKDELGAYSFSSTFSGIPLQEIGPVVTRVVPGVFSEVQDRRDELQRYFLLLTEFISYLAFPMSIGMALTADLFVPLLLGDQWHAVVAPTRILCLYTIFGAAQLLVSHAMLWTGQFRAQMWCTVLSAVVMPVAFWYAVEHGPVAIAWTWVAVYPLTNIPALAIAFRTVRITVWGWLFALLPAAAASVAMAVAVVALRSALPPTVPLLLQMVASAALGAAIYAAVGWLAFRERVLAIVRIVWPGRRRPFIGAT
jgi:O-antigen/teichoic acid export membrane protein